MQQVRGPYAFATCQYKIAFKWQSKFPVPGVKHLYSSYKMLYILLFMSFHGYKKKTLPKYFLSL